MKDLLKLISFLGLGLTVIPAFLVFTGTFSWQVHSAMMLAGTLLWFSTASVWIDAGDRP